MTNEEYREFAKAATCRQLIEADPAWPKGYRARLCHVAVLPRAVTPTIPTLSAYRTVGEAIKAAEKAAGCPLRWKPRLDADVGSVSIYSQSVPRPEDAHEYYEITHW